MLLLSVLVENLLLAWKCIFIKISYSFIFFISISVLLYIDLHPPTLPTRFIVQWDDRGSSSAQLPDQHIRGVLNNKSFLLIFTFLIYLIIWYPINIEWIICERTQRLVTRTQTVSMCPLPPSLSPLYLTSNYFWGATWRS